MPTSVYFGNGTRSEQTLYEDIVVESLKVYGQDMTYLPRAITKDRILNDVSTSSFYDAYTIEMYIENTNGFEGDQTLMSKFGLEIRDQATFVVARRSWEKFVGLYNNAINSIRPLEGDLLYYPPTNSFFEIKFVEHQQPFYQLKNLPTYKLQCELFEYSDEIFDTGNPLIDAAQTYNAQSTVMKIVSGIGATELVIGETVVQGLSGGVFIFAEITNLQSVQDEPDSRLVWVSNLTTSDKEFHEMQSGIRIVGQSSLSSWLVDIIYDMGDADVDFTFPQNEFAQNRDFEIEGDDVIDFSETNPFGDPSTNKGGNYFSPADTAVSDRPLFVVSIDTITVDTTSITVDKI